MDTDFIHSGLKVWSRERKMRKAMYKLFFPLLSVMEGEGFLTSLWALCHFTPNPLPLESPLLCFTVSSRSGRWLQLMRWSINKERDFYTCWLRGEALDAHSTGKKKELEAGFFWGQQLLPLLFLSLNFHLIPEVGVPFSPCMVLEICADACARVSNTLLCFRDLCV